MMELTKISKKLSFLLRHCTEPRYIDLDGGWADVEQILEVLASRYPGTDRKILEQIVADDEKGRYSFNEDHSKIRANQGHSVAGVVIRMEQPEPPEFLYHGTAERFLSAICQEGLKPMSRQYVHISPDIATATEVGKRHGKPVILVIRAKDFVADGHKLYRSSNGVWLAEEVPAAYFTVQTLADCK